MIIVVYIIPSVPINIKRLFDVYSMYIRSKMIKLLKKKKITYKTTNKIAIEGEKAYKWGTNKF